MIWSMKPVSRQCENVEFTIITFARRERLRMRRDGDGTVIVAGRLGHLYEAAPGLMALMIMPDPPRGRYWGCLRQRLKQCGFEILQDADGEGSAGFDPYDRTQIPLAIKAAGVRRIPKRSPIQLEAARRGLLAANLAKKRLNGAAK
jgi:hypothetical protein